MSRKNIDLFLTAIVALANILWAFLPSHPPVIGMILALPLVFLLPGYVLTEAFFPKRPFDHVYRFIMFIGLSLSTDIISGIILNILPIGLQASSWAVFLGLLTVIFSLLVAYHRRGSSREDTQRPRFRFFRFSIHEYILLAVSIGVMLLSIAYAAISVPQQPHPSLTQLWMIPSPQSDNSCAVALGVHNLETTPQAYRITMAVNGTQINTWPSIILAPQEKWEQLAPIPIKSASSIYVEAWLYKSDKPNTVYHEVHITLKALKGSQDQKIQC